MDSDWIIGFVLYMLIGGFIVSQALEHLDFEGLAEEMGYLDVWNKAGPKTVLAAAFVVVLVWPLVLIIAIADGLFGDD